MALAKGTLLVLLIVLSGLSVGALAGYRMILHSGIDEDSYPRDVTVTIDWPDASMPPSSRNVTVAGWDTTALGATQAATSELGITLRTWHYEGMGEYVLQIGPFEADRECGWLYAAGPEGAPEDADQAADLTRVHDGDVVAWRWGCV